METKKCPKCGETKTLDNFGVRKKSGRPNSYCRPCASAAVKASVAKRAPKEPWDGAVCTKCKQPKPASEFGKRKDTRTGLQPRCKMCRKEAKRARLARDPWHFLWQAAKDRANHPRYLKKYGKPLDFDLDEVDLQAMWNRQNGLCHWFHVPMTTDSFGTNDPAQVSVDRLDSDKGYVPGNVVLCSQAANIGKQQTDPAGWEQFCALIRAGL